MLDDITYIFTTILITDLNCFAADSHSRLHAFILRQRFLRSRPLLSGQRTTVTSPNCHRLQYTYSMCELTGDSLVTGGGGSTPMATVIAERVNFANMRRKVNPISG